MGVPVPSTQPTIAFVVSEIGAAACRGDYFTAVELAEALSGTLGWSSRFLVEGEHPYDLDGVDILVVMTHTTDPRHRIRVGPNLLIVAWMRNWFDAWLQQPWFEEFGLHLVSSPVAARHISIHGKVTPRIFPLATQPRRFEAGRRDAALASDVCFAGGYWESPRRITTAAQSLKGVDFSIFGPGWDRVPDMAPFWRGVLPYERMSDLYASTRIVIDDANHTTDAWGSVNSRVFDAIAAGTLVISNGAVGARALFGDDLPIYDSAQGLRDLVDHYLSHEDERQRRIASLRATVLKHHTYAARAVALDAEITDLARVRRKILVRAAGLRGTCLRPALVAALRAQGHKALVQADDSQIDVVLDVGAPQDAVPAGKLRVLWTRRPVIAHGYNVACSDLPAANSTNTLMTNLPLRRWERILARLGWLTPRQISAMVVELVAIAERGLRTISDKKDGCR